MSQPQGRVRKSNRQPVPNPIYQQGINQLKNENTSRIKKKTRQDDENFSFQQQRNSQQGYDQSFNSYGEGRDYYMPCKMPDGSRLKVMFVVEGKKEEKKKDKERQRERERERQRQKQRQKQHVSPSPVVTKSAPSNQNQKKPTNLLNLFLSAIDKVEEGDLPNEQVNLGHKIPSMIPLQKQKPVLVKPKKAKVQQLDFIKKITIEDGIMKISHSQMGQVQVPVDWQENHMAAEEDHQVQKIRNILKNSPVLKNISILTT